MSKIAVVGVEGCGKTVLMSAFGDKYKRPDENGIFLSPEDPVAFGFVEVLMNRMRNGEWPAATMIDTPRSLEWGLYHKKNEENEKLCDIQFLDFAGEVYRFAFGTKHTQEEMANSEASISRLKNFINNSDALIVLFNLGDAINGDVNDERTREAQWLSKGILDYVFGKTKIKKALMVFTQADSYRAVIEQHGGIAATYRHYLPHVANLYDDVPTIAVSAVNRTKPDSEGGYPTPAEGFSSEGLEDIMEWIITNIPGYEDFFGEVRRHRERLHALYHEVDKLCTTYWNLVESQAPSVRRYEVAEELYAGAQELQNILNDKDGWVVDVEASRRLIYFALAAHSFEQEVGEQYALVQRGRATMDEVVQNLFGCHPRFHGLQNCIEAEVGRLEARCRRRKTVTRVVALIIVLVTLIGLALPLCVHSNAKPAAKTVVGSFASTAICELDKKETVRPVKEEPLFEFHRKNVIDLPDGVKLVMVKIPAGDFMMGSPSSEDKRKNDEHQHRVTISLDFWFGETEVTQAQYEALTGKTPSHFRGNDRPVECVSWHDATNFCEKLNTHCQGKLPSGYRFDLPTEGQWEYACRGGTSTPFSFGQISDTGKMNFDENHPYGTEGGISHRKETVVVGSLGYKNAWGLSDMHGNVYEWCKDWYGKDYYENSPSVDPQGPVGGEGRVLRGGSWYNYDARDCRSANRYSNFPTGCGNYIGFRVALVPGLKPAKENKKGKNNASSDLITKMLAAMEKDSTTVVSSKAAKENKKGKANASPNLIVKMLAAMERDLSARLSLARLSKEPKDWDTIPKLSNELTMEKKRYAAACYMLGRHEMGRNLEEAMNWCREAADRGYEKAKEDLKRIEDSIMSKKR